MKLPSIHGRIDRRILANYRVDPDALQRLLPEPFRVKTVGGFGIAGICLIRLVEARPRFVPGLLGFSSENAAHRIAVEWDTPGGVREGVYVPRRDTSSWLNTVAGGRLFPGDQSRARFTVHESESRYEVALRSLDGETRVDLVADIAPELPADSVFADLAAASSFFAGGAVGYSATPKRGCFDCIELDSFTWDVQPLRVEKFASSFFDDKERFPDGSTTPDCALLMRGIEHRWVARDAMRVGAR